MAFTGVQLGDRSHSNWLRHLHNSNEAEVGHSVESRILRSSFECPRWSVTALKKEKVEEKNNKSKVSGGLSS